MTAAKETELERRLKRLEEKILGLTAQRKESMNTKEAAAYLGYSVAHIHRLTTNKQIPFYKPNGRYVYFFKGELDEWIKTRRTATKEEINAKAEEYLMEKGGIR